LLPGHEGILPVACSKGKYAPTRRRPGEVAAAATGADKPAFPSSDKPAFRAAYRRRRCLVIADGWYEWQAVGKQKQPHLFTLRERRPLAFAGLWESWQGAGGEVLETCAILTTAANGLVRPVHNRMPVIVPTDAYARWLALDVQDPAAIADHLTPYLAGRMTATPVSRRVNNPRFDDPACLEPEPPGAGARLA
jgi:putative SOS response-associated peptidase YedK